MAFSFLSMVLSVKSKLFRFQENIQLSFFFFCTTSKSNDQWKWGGRSEYYCAQIRGDAVYLRHFHTQRTTISFGDYEQRGGRERLKRWCRWIYAYVDLDEHHARHCHFLLIFVKIFSFFFHNLYSPKHNFFWNLNWLM